MVKLGINIDHIATLRQARLAKEPDPVMAAGICEMAGADGITVHLREDRRHIQDRDVQVLRKTIKTRLNLEMAAVEEMAKIAAGIKPDSVCLVPEKRQELTTEGGLDVAAKKKEVAPVVKKLKAAGIIVSIFVDPERKQIEAAADIGADCVELHTGSYAEAFAKSDQLTGNALRELKRLESAGALARELELTLNAGHGLDYRNVAPVAQITGMHELNIGFSIIARAVFVGLEQAVKEMKSLITD
ncbi:MAG: pyridoxine 5'-phosphate synthase [Elusimicrobiota bacterium]